MVPPPAAPNAAALPLPLPAAPPQAEGAPKAAVVPALRFVPKSEVAVAANMASACSPKSSHSGARSSGASTRADPDEWAAKWADEINAEIYFAKKGADKQRLFEE